MICEVGQDPLGNLFQQTQTHTNSLTLYLSLPLSLPYYNYMYNGDIEIIS